MCCVVGCVVDCGCVLCLLVVGLDPADPPPPCPSTIFILSPLSWGSFRGILVFEAPGPSNVHVGSRAVA